MVIKSVNITNSTNDLPAHRAKIINIINTTNNLPTHRAKIINILNFNSEKLSVIRNNNDKTNVCYDNKPFFLTIDGLKGYFEEHDNEKTQYLDLKKLNI